MRAAIQEFHMKLVVFGDSILKGVITIPESKNLFDVTQNDSLSLAQKELGFEMDNRSIYGNITSKGLVKLQKFLEKGGKADFCIIEFGSNDCDYDWNVFPEGQPAPDFAEINPKVQFDEYLANLTQMTGLCRAHKITPVIMNLIPYVCDRWFKTIAKAHNETAMLEFLHGTPDTLGKNQQRYQNALMEFASTSNIQTIDAWTLFTNTQNSATLMCDDGIHPNEDGYKLLSKLWIERIPQLKREF